MTVNNTNWSDSGTPANATWSRTSGIDTDIALYDDATISYDDPLIYYDDYDATVITTEDVKFSTWTDAT